LSDPCDTANGLRGVVALDLSVDAIAAVERSQNADEGTAADAASRVEA
jgi:hypothetical protein